MVGFSTVHQHMSLAADHTSLKRQRALATLTLTLTVALPERDT